MFGNDDDFNPFKKADDLIANAGNLMSESRNAQVKIAQLEYAKWAVEMKYKYKKPIQSIFKDVEFALDELTKPKKVKK